MRFLMPACPLPMRLATTPTMPVTSSQKAELAWIKRKLVLLMPAHAEGAPVWQANGWRTLMAEDDWQKRLAEELGNNAVKPTAQDGIRQKRCTNEFQTKSGIGSGFPASEFAITSTSAVQGKVLKWALRFQSDPTSNGINYKPINGARDKNLKSVRIDQDWRGIVFKPPAGDVYVLMYVDRHDAAYKWAEGRRVAVNPTTGALQVFAVESLVEPALGQARHAAAPTRHGTLAGDRIASTSHTYFCRPVRSGVAASGPRKNCWRRFDPFIPRSSWMPCNPTCRLKPTKVCFWLRRVTVSPTC